MWEREDLVRERARAEHRILVWPEPHLVGAPSLRAFSMNRVIIELTAQWWAPQCDQPESLQIATIREEASLVFQKETFVVQVLHSTCFQVALVHNKGTKLRRTRS